MESIPHTNLDDTGPEESLAYTAMPRGMETYTAPDLPTDLWQRASGGVALLQDLLQHLGRSLPASAANRYCLKHLQPADLELLAQVLGEGEVSVVCSGPQQLQIQESTLTGVWRVTGEENYLEVAPFPSAALALAGQSPSPDPGAEPAPAGGELVNAPSILAELGDAVAAYRPGNPAHVVNFSLLPVSTGELAWLQQQLGLGWVRVLSRGYGNCRITATGWPNCWWVQFFNSEDTLILNTIEVVEVPQVACAASEDLQDSAVRLADILSAYQ